MSAPEYLEYFEVDVSADPDNPNSDTESEDIDEENNNVDNEDDEDDVDEDFDDNADTIPFPQDDEDENETFPQGIQGEIIVDDNARLDESREDEVEIVGEDIGLEVVAETAVVPDTEDDTDVEEIEYPLPVINTATTEEVLGISTDSVRTVEASEDTHDALEPETNRAAPSPQPGPSRGGRGQGQTVVKSVSRGKRLPWVDNDDNDTSDSESEEASVRQDSAGNEGSGSVRSSESVITTAPSVSHSCYTSMASLRNEQGRSVDSRRDFDRRRFWRQLSTTTEDLDSIEPTVGPRPDIRIRPAASLLPSPSSTLTTSVSSIWRVQDPVRSSISLAPHSHPPSPHLVQPPLTSPNPARPPSPPLDSPPSSPLPRRRAFPCSPPPQSPMYSPLQLSLSVPRISTPRFEPASISTTAIMPRTRGRMLREHAELQSPAPGPGGAGSSSGTARVYPHQHSPNHRAAERVARIDRILELTRRSQEDVRSQETEAHRASYRLLTEIAMDREQNNRIDRTLAAGRRSLERAQSLISRQRERDQESVVNEFVRDSPSTEEQPPAKRVRLDTSLSTVQYEADIAEALKRSLIDQGGAPEEAQLQPQPGCSHWEDSSNTNTTTEDNVAGPGADDGVEADGTGEGDTAETPPDYEALYKELRASNKKLVTELQSSLECPVCLETIREAPVLCCRNGHLICKVCIVRTQICPTCRAPLGVGLSQKCVSHVANRLVDLLPHPCTNKDRGCTEELLLTLLTRHETECRYRDVRCPVGYCLQTLPMASLSSHISGSPHNLATHNYAAPLTFIRGVPAVLGPPGPVFQGLKSFDPIRFTFAGQNFYLQTIASQDRRLLYHFVQVEGNREDCNKFWVKLTVSSVGRFTPSHASQTVRPAPLDQHCRDDLQAIGYTLVMTERSIININKWDPIKGQHIFQVEVEMIQDTGSEADQTQEIPTQV